MELREAMNQIAEIRRQMAAGSVFRGYRAATTAFSGLLALATAAAQALWLPMPAHDIGGYVTLWITAAVVSLAVVGAEMFVRVRRSSAGVQKQLTMLAVEQFVPSLVAGGLLTYGLFAYASNACWMLPGLWMILFSLGVFASSRLLPRAVFGIAGFYLVAGVVTFVLSADAAGPWRYSPWLMGGVFAVGQLATAGILYAKLERGQ